MAGVILEIGRSKVFATAAEWPGWCRSGRGEDAAIAALADAAPRYAVVAARAGLAFPAGLADELTVLERLPGDGTTEFGAPGKVAELDRAPLDEAAAARRAALLRAAWTVFDQVAAAAPAILRKGPRGGGRDRDQVVTHVLDSEAGYARQLGLRMAAPAGVADAAGLRSAISAALSRPSDGSPVAPPRRWPPRYAGARLAWHVLDHAWEMEDKS